MKYTVERNVQILISLLKQYGISRVVASPGTANMSFVASIQNDDFFEIYSSIDERSAAYMACGIASETNEPVVITCTEATASRNYMPGLTEAYYRKLPVLAVMTSHGENLIGSFEPQVIDNRNIPNDIVNYSVKIQECKDKDDERYVEVHINEAINHLTINGGGPVRILLESVNSYDYSAEFIPNANIIRIRSSVEDLPSIPEGNIVVFVGSHRKWASKEVEVLDKFCECNNAVVLCDMTSNYTGKYRVNYALVSTQEGFREFAKSPKLVIYIGNVSGDYYTSDFCRLAEQEWGVSEDGGYRDRFHNLTEVIKMDEYQFFNNYCNTKHTNTSYYEELNEEYNKIRDLVPELPFSNLWIASVSSQLVPKRSTVHAAINNSLRSWNYFWKPDTVMHGSCNVGGYGIDGGLSTFIGASIVAPEKLFFIIIGDLAFFYDMNVLGNRHIGNNVRILLINNGKGQEFRNYQHPASKFGEDADLYIAAGGHYACQSRNLVKGYAESLGYTYLSAENKEEYLSLYERFFSEENLNTPMLFEVFTNTDDENKALELVRNIVPKSTDMKEVTKEFAKKIIGKKVAHILKTLKTTVVG